MIFVEFAAFSRHIGKHLDDEQYRMLQNTLLNNPDAGARIPGTGGLRKIRWAAKGRGKRGGVRVIYYPVKSRSVILLLLLYAKNEQDDLTPDSEEDS